MQSSTNPIQSKEAYVKQRGMNGPMSSASGHPGVFPNMYAAPAAWPAYAMPPFPFHPSALGPLQPPASPTRQLSSLLVPSSPSKQLAALHPDEGPALEDWLPQLNLGYNIDSAQLLSDLNGNDLWNVLDIVRCTPDELMKAGCTLGITKRLKEKAEIQMKISK